MKQILTKEYSKRSLGVILTLALVLGMMLANPVDVRADDSDYGRYYKGFKYNIRGNGVYIKAYRGSKSKITVPNKIKGKYVVSVDLDEEGLRSINVKKVKKLKYLDVSDNRLKSLNVTKNKKLVKLECSENRLTKLNVTKNKKLRKLDCSDNNIGSLNLKNNKQLRELDIEGNRRLGHITFQKLSHLKYLNEFNDAYGRDWERYDDDDD